MSLLNRYYFQNSKAYHYQLSLKNDYELWKCDDTVPISITWFSREVSFWIEVLPESKTGALRLVSLVRVPENMKSLRYIKQ